MVPLGALLAPPADSGDPFGLLLACHRRIEQRLETLARAAAALDDSTAEAVQAIANALHFLSTAGALHTADEEESLFPRLLPRIEPGERTLLATLEHHHTEARVMQAELADLLLATPSPEWHRRIRGLVDRLVNHYRVHIHCEDTVVMPMARNALAPGELAEIAREISGRRSS
jgi:hemerythrin-like domain-containing protein